MSALKRPESTLAPSALPRPTRGRIRIAVEPADPDRFREARVTALVVNYLQGVGAGRPRGASEIYSYANVAGILGAESLRKLLETLVGRGVLAGHDGIVTGYQTANRRPFRGYTALVSVQEPAAAPGTAAPEFSPGPAWDGLRERTMQHVRAVAFRLAHCGTRPNVEQLALETGLHHKTVRAARRRLKAAGDWPRPEDVDTGEGETATGTDGEPADDPLRPAERDAIAARIAAARAFRLNATGDPCSEGRVIMGDSLDVFDAIREAWTGAGLAGEPVVVFRAAAVELHGNREGDPVVRVEPYHEPSRDIHGWRIVRDGTGYGRHAAPENAAKAASWVFTDARMSAAFERRAPAPEAVSR